MLGDRLDGRIDAVGDRLDGRIGALGDRMDGLEQRMELRFGALENPILATLRSELNSMVLKMFVLVIALVPALVVPPVTLR